MNEAVKTESAEINDLAGEVEEKSTAEENTNEEVKEEKSVLDSDIAELRQGFGELSGITSITDLPSPTRYAALRDLGLSPTEAYLATSRPKSDGKAHLTSSVPRAKSGTVLSMTKQEMSIAREIFHDMDDLEIQKLYKKVTN